MNDYQMYLNSICDIPEFLNKYLELDSMKRLKDISLLCGMDYASPHMYNFKYYISRYDHSLGVALITWKLTHDKAQTLAALFHDISTPVFSHVIDYMNGDYVNQESTEDKTYEVLISTKNLLEYLKEDNLSIEDIVDFKNYSIVDLPRPSLCADRVENTISGGMAWAGIVDYQHAMDVINNIYLDKNESNQDEIGLKSSYVGKYVYEVNNYLNELTHQKEDTYMMILLADLVRLMIDNNIIIYDDLYRLTEHEFFKIVEDHLYISDIRDYYNIFKTVKDPIIDGDVKIKNRVLNPIINGKRMV